MTASTNAQYSRSHRPDAALRLRSPRGGEASCTYPPGTRSGNTASPARAGAPNRVSRPVFLEIPSAVPAHRARSRRSSHGAGTLPTGSGGVSARPPTTAWSGAALGSSPAFASTSRFLDQEFEHAHRSP